MSVKSLLEQIVKRASRFKGIDFLATKQVADGKVSISAFEKSSSLRFEAISVPPVPDFTAPALLGSLPYLDVLLSTEQFGTDKSAIVLENALGVDGTPCVRTIRFSGPRMKASYQAVDPGRLKVQIPEFVDGFAFDFFVEISPSLQKDFRDAAALYGKVDPSAETFSIEVVNDNIQFVFGNGGPQDITITVCPAPAEYKGGRFFLAPVSTILSMVGADGGGLLHFCPASIRFESENEFARYTFDILSLDE